MNGLQKKSLAIAVTMAFFINLVPMSVNAETKETANSETVNVGFIKDGERSTLFNQDWRFFKGNPSGAEGIDFNDSAWRNLNLPHDWSIESEFTVQGEAESGFLLGGTGWYRKHFVVPEKFEGRDFTLNFDGVYMNAEVYVNGQKVGEHNYGYTGFAFDITDELVCDGQTENIIAVKVSNPVPTSRWYSGSGIYRDVTLSVTDSIHVSHLGTTVTTPNIIAVKVSNPVPTSRWYSGSGIYRDVTLSVTDSIHVSHLGTTVTTPNLKEQKDGAVDVNVETVIENESLDNSNVTVKTTIIDTDGQSVSKPVTTSDNVAKDATKTFEQTVVVNNPNLWSIDNPNMYQVKTEVDYYNRHRWTSS